MTVDMGVSAGKVLVVVEARRGTLARVMGAINLAADPSCTRGACPVLARRGTRAERVYVVDGGGLGNSSAPGNR